MHLRQVWEGPPCNSRTSASGSCEPGLRRAKVRQGKVSQGKWGKHWASSNFAKSGMWLDHGTQ